MSAIHQWAIGGVGEVAVAVLSVAFWRKISRLPWKWLWIGVGLWIVAVALKALCGVALNPKVFGFLTAHLSHVWVCAVGGLFLGIESSFFEVGLTFVAVLRWRRLGQNAPEATGIGVGAGAFEALVLGLTVLAAVAIELSGIPEAKEITREVTKTASTPLFWLLPIVERVVCMVGHTSSRALVLLGVTHRRPTMVLLGWLIFTSVDGVGAAFIISSKMRPQSMWWVEIAILPLALIEIFLLRWCWVKFRPSSEPV